MIHPAIRGIFTMIRFNEKEMLRYLGFRHGTEPDDEMKESIGRCVDDLQKAVYPKAIGQYFDLNVSGDEVRFAGLSVKSRSLSKNLSGCTCVYLFAATLGIGPDRLIARAQVRKMSDALILQAASASMIESVCNTINTEIDRKASEAGLFTRPRFSPGYGDCPIELQSDITRLLDTPKKIGLTLTGSMMMLPTKSVTAMIGITSEPTRHHPGGCAACEVKDCEFREES